MWMLHNLIPYCHQQSLLTWLSLSQFIREYTGKVDELIKDKIEAQNEAKAKENEEKDVMKQQVHSKPNHGYN